MSLMLVRWSDVVLNRHLKEKVEPLWSVPGQWLIQPELIPVRKNILTKVKETLCVQSARIRWMFHTNCYFAVTTRILTMPGYLLKAMVDGREYGLRK